METIIMQIQSLCIVLLIILGIRFKRETKKHIKIMLFAITWDILLILQIELSRSAILKASKAASNPMMLNIHVSIAILTVVFYLLMGITGRKILKGQLEMKTKHKFLGYSTLALRILTFVTSFWAVTPKV
jgi:hypothetical protein